MPRYQQENSGCTSSPPRVPAKSPSTAKVTVQPAAENLKPEDLSNQACAENLTLPQACKTDKDSGPHSQDSMTQKLQIVSKLFPMLPEYFARFILTSCGGEISKTIDFILSKNLNDPCKTMPLLPHGIFNTSLYSRLPTSGFLGNTTPFCRFPAFQPMTSSLDSFRSPWNFYGQLPGCSVPIRLTHDGKSITNLPDSNSGEMDSKETNDHDVKAVNLHGGSV